MKKNKQVKQSEKYAIKVGNRENFQKPPQIVNSQEGPIHASLIIFLIPFVWYGGWVGIGS